MKIILNYRKEEYNDSIIIYTFELSENSIYYYAIKLIDGVWVLCLEIKNAVLWDNRKIESLDIA